MVNTIMYCRECGKSLPQYSKFCMYCGTKVELVQQDELDSSLRLKLRAKIDAGESLKQANLREANLTSANLSSANLSEADLFEADLTAADLIGANLSGADLSFAVLSGARYSSDTKFPEGFDPEEAGMMLIEEVD